MFMYLDKFDLAGKLTGFRELCPLDEFLSAYAATYVSDAKLDLIEYGAVFEKKWYKSSEKSGLSQQVNK